MIVKEQSNSNKNSLPTGAEHEKYQVGRPHEYLSNRILRTVITLAGLSDLQVWVGFTSLSCPFPV